MIAPSDRELQAALAAIRATDADADVLTHGVEEIYCVDHPEERLVFLSAVQREALSEGDEYITWVVSLFRGEPTNVSFFRSRACAAGNETLPT